MFNPLWMKIPAAVAAVVIVWMILGSYNKTAYVACMDKVKIHDVCWEVLK